MLHYITTFSYRSGKAEIVGPKGVVYYILEYYILYILLKIDIEFGIYNLNEYYNLKIGSH